MMIRPSNSGTATWVATSSGLIPSSEAAQEARSQVRQSPCRMGMSRAASARTSQASSSSPADAVAGLVPPAASTVVTRASRVPRKSIRSAGRVPQRGGEDRHGRAAGGIDRVGQRLDVRGVPGGVLGAVEEDADPRSPLRAGRLRPRQQPPHRLLDRRLEADAGEQHRVGQEGVQLGQVLRSALGQVDVRIGGHPDGHGGQFHQRGIRGLLAAQHHHRLSGPPDPVEPTAQALRRAEDPGHDQIGRGESVGHLGVRDLGRVDVEVVGAAGAGRQQIGVGRGDQGDTRH